MLRIYIIPLLILYACLCLQAQDSGFPNSLETLSVGQGLSNSAVYCLLQDRQGFIWAGTQGGLNRYDGYGFVTYDRVPGDSTALKDNFINCLLEDRDGSIWAGTRQGLSRLNKLKGTFTHYFSNPADPIHLLCDHILSLVEDPYGNLYAATKGGLLFWEKGKRQLQRIPLNIENGKLPEPLQINVLALDEQGLLWMGTGTGLLRFDTKTRQCHQFSGPRGRLLPPVQALFQEGEELLWVGTLEGVFQINKVTGGVKAYSPQPGILAEVATITKDSHGRLLVGNIHGVSILDAQTGLFTHFFSFKNSYDWFRPSRPQAILEDRNNTFWLASLWEGVFHFNPGIKRFRHIYRKPSPGKPAPDNTVVGVYEDSRGQVWYGTGKDLNIFDPATGKISTLFTQQDALFKTVLEDRQGTIWVGARFGTIKMAKGQPPVRYDSKPNDPQYSRPRNVKAIFEDHAGMLWFGGGNGLFRHILGSEVFQHFALEQTTVDTNIIYHITEDTRHQLWASTNNGLLRIDSDRKQVKYFFHDPSDPRSLCDNNVSSVAATQNGQVWVASYDGGLDRFDGDGKGFTHFGRKQGLIDEKVWGLVEDGRGFLWMSTSKGLSRFDPKTGNFQNFDVKDGLQDYEFTLAGFNKGQKTGKLYFGGVNGFNVFHPDSLNLNQVPPPVAFTSFRYHDGSLESTEFKNIPGICALNEVVLPYRAKAIVCEFAALDYWQSSKNHYAYRLEGVHQNWVDLGAKREVTFANLSPGTYTLHVKASNNDGVWNEEGAKLRIVIRPPWWASWWAYLLYAVSLAASAWFFYRYQLRLRLRKQETQRLKELDEFKNRFFTNVTHEFRTPLTVILGMSERILSDGVTQNHPVTIAQPLTLIKRNGENLLRLINQLLDLAKLESSTLKINYVRGDVLPYLCYIAESLQSLAEMQGVSLRVETKPGQVVMDYDPERLLQIVHNLLSNAIKFTPGGGRVALSVACEERKDLAGFQNLPSLKITVADTGVGIPTEDLPHLFDRFYQAKNLEKAKAGGTGIGLALTKELVALLGGDIAVESKVGKGSTFTVHLPIAQTAELRSLSVGVTSSHPDTISAGSRSGVTSSHPDTTLPQVLIVEDNPDVVEYIAACLSASSVGGAQGEAYHLDFAYNGRTGIEKAIETIPDLIISDVMMPEKDGFDLCEALKNDERTSHIPIVLLTAKADVENRITGLRRGADAYLAKPFHREELLAWMAQLLAQRQRLRDYFNAVARSPSATGDAQTAAGQSVAALGMDFAIEDAFFEKLRGALEAHYEDAEFSVDDLCRHLAMSRTQVHRKISALLNCSTTDYINRFRLDKALDLLRNSTQNVSEIAYAVGYNDPRYFTRLFAERFGASPSEWRTKR